MFLSKQVQPLWMHLLHFFVLIMSHFHRYMIQYNVTKNKVIEMKKIIFIMSVLLMILITGCTASTHVRLPNLEGKVESEILDILKSKELDVEFIYMLTEKEQSREFISYGNFFEPGDRVEKGSLVYVLVSATLFDDEIYFTVANIAYDGPRLDPAFFDFEDYYIVYGYDEDTSQPIYIGTGKAFPVEYDLSRDIGRCIDGDTTRFRYPEGLMGVITQNTSTRYFNIDTPETWPPDNREEWGKQATEYVCDLLNEAVEIVLQTDPGDGITDRYGRLLAWVWIRLPEDDDFMLLNYLVTRQGLAEVRYLFGAGETEITMYEGLTYTEWMFLAEERANEDGLGMHGDDLDWYWDYDEDRPYPGRW